MILFQVLEEEQMQENADFSESPLPIVLETESQRSAGRPTLAQQDSKSKGSSIRDSLMLELGANGYKHPSRSGTHYNALGHVYLDY